MHCRVCFALRERLIERLADYGVLLHVANGRAKSAQRDQHSDADITMARFAVDEAERKLREHEATHRVTH